MFYLLTGLAWLGLHWLCMHEVEEGGKERDVMKVPTYIRIYATATGTNESSACALARVHGHLMIEHLCLSLF